MSLTDFEKGFQHSEAERFARMQRVQARLEQEALAQTVETFVREHKLYTPPPSYNKAEVIIVKK
ncbi:MAG: hypothetical protein US60_C0044G0013 [Microgenomates group bacterium GW2011_GWC1_37_8]|uniref:Uncharacterized protein n=1 Tax=Candidatus Woesebacteria bacterium GW2011_GWB1_38_8 TaxID=1618570 RepID=A0A0G0LBW0_9BACT|nr:MAG: hypothetical protein US60_C0044G0013 [Microgenomates group bacterium GW2011_GWC1_37_8]KKQ85350.1 MAG: hypothetical protein UT08_C0007G0023 [Candidatus Woesebacteria bacterium GW2011_GWB1_38_8]